MVVAKMDALFGIFRIFEVSLYVNISVPLQQTSKDVNEYKFKLNEVIPGIHLW